MHYNVKKDHKGQEYFEVDQADFDLIRNPLLNKGSAFSEEERNRLGITQGLVRLSVGIEDVEDLLADLEQALPAI